MTGSPFILIKTAVFSGVSEVRLYEETIDHIQAEHPEIPILLPSLYASIPQAIIQPTHIEGSYGNAYIFVDAGTTNASGDPLRVPVKMIEGASGRVRTAYFASPSGNQNIVWRRS